MKSWFAINPVAAAAGAEKVVEVQIFDDIGGWGVLAKDFLDEVKAKADGIKNVRVMMNTPGGSVYEALTMLNGLRAMGKTIETHVMGLAASAGSLFAAGSHKVVMPDNTMQFVHLPITGCYGNAEDMRETADVLDKVGGQMKAMYAKRWKGTAEELDAALSAQTHYTAAECLALGLCDEVVEAVGVAAKFEAERLEKLPEAVRALFIARKPPEQDPAPAAAPLAARIKDAAEKVGLGEYAADFAMDKGLADDASIQAALSVALEVKALCDVAGLADKAPGLIKARTSLADARAQLCEARAQTSDEQHVRTQRSGKSTEPAPAATINPTEIYAKANAYVASKRNNQRS